MASKSGSAQAGLERAGRKAAGGRAIFHQLTLRARLEIRAGALSNLFGALNFSFATIQYSVASPMSFLIVVLSQSNAATGGRFVS